MTNRVRIYVAAVALLLFGVFDVAAVVADCDVNATHVVCESPSPKSPLIHLRNGRELRTVESIVVHNNVLDLTSDIFVFEESLSKVTMVDFRSNEIDRIGRRGFEKLRGAQFVYLSNNRITHVQKDPFLVLNKLQYLEMNEAFGEMDATQSRDAVSALFVSPQKKHALTEVKLNKNRLAQIDKNAFCNVKKLLRLELADNQLRDFDFVGDCLGSLEALIVAGNQITTVGGWVWDALQSLSSLDVSRNPLHCDCALAQLAADEKIRFLNQGETRCATPPSLAGRVVFDVAGEACRSSSAASFLFLLVVGVGVVVAYRWYRRKLDNGGYESIQRHAAPQFV